METVLALKVDGPVVRVSGDVDDRVSLIGVVERALTLPTGRVVVDLRDATSINEPGVAGLLAARRLCNQADVELQVAQSEEVQACLQRYGLGSSFAITTLD